MCLQSHFSCKISSQVTFGHLGQAGLHLLVTGLRCEFEVVVVKVVRYSRKVEVIVDTKLIDLSSFSGAPHGIVGVWANVHNHKLVLLVKNLVLCRCPNLKASWQLSDKSPLAAGSTSHAGSVSSSTISIASATSILHGLRRSHCQIPSPMH